MRRYLSLNARLIPLNLCLILGTLIVGACATQASDPAPSDQGRAACVARADSLMGAATDLEDALADAATGDPGATRRLVRDSRTFIARGRAIVADCRHLDPEAADELSDSLDEFEDAVDLIELYG